MNLFKTKKDGKTVGYLYIIKSAVWRLNQDIYVKFCNENITLGYADTTRWALYDCVECFDFDEALPYVCNDKNGEKVFAGDKATGIVWGEDLTYRTTGIVTYHKTGFCIDSDKTIYAMCDLSDIELIKEADNVRQETQG